MTEHDTQIYLICEVGMGETIERVAYALIDLSRKLGIATQADFNGKIVYAYPHSTMREVVDMYYGRTQ